MPVSFGSIELSAFVGPLCPLLGFGALTDDILALTETTPTLTFCPISQPLWVSTSAQELECRDTHVPRGGAD